MVLIKAGADVIDWAVSAIGDGVNEIGHLAANAVHQIDDWVDDVAGHVAHGVASDLAGSVSLKASGWRFYKTGRKNQIGFMLPDWGALDCGTSVGLETDAPVRQLHLTDSQRR